ncbi:hypothetical protein TWF694_001923 [Orbilia ellipsospora]|uniref:DUF7587 domain-containing protein n=1 Tax=Orbilia ellipsospora TaxID=2528407 RepID=A0AAV9X434_9PEZI
MSQQPTEQPCLFQPRRRHGALDDGFDQVPQYLFRTWAPQTNGYNDEDVIMPAAVYNGKTSSDLLSFDDEFAREMLCDHLLWKNRFDDNLTSWTSSLFYALQLARYRNALDRRKFTYPGNIYICVLDTRKFDRKTFLPAPALLVAYSVRSQGKLTHSYSEGEFLSQGQLDIRGKSKVVTYEDLVSHGLNDIFPRNVPETKLWWAVHDYRKAWLSDIAIDEIELKSSHSLASKCFGEEWYLPMIAMLLALKPRSVKDDRIDQYPNSKLR